MSVLKRTSFQTSTAVNTGTDSLSVDSGYVPAQLDLPRAAGWTKFWMEKFLRSHARCDRPSHSSFPTRFIDVSVKDRNSVVLKDELSTPGLYVALSYCLGTTKKNLMTTSDNLHLHKNWIAWNTLPQYFKDAIQLC